MSIDKEYLPVEVEKRWIRRWAEADLFRADPTSGKPPFCMVIPPPNVTGNLHIGHVLVYTLHDVVARWRRMQGHDVLWLPGTDHAGIATQMVVERALRAEGKSRREMGREAFEERVWEWKETYGNRITDALRTLGSSCDWSRERFTLDEGLSRAVRTVFVKLYEKDLIYRGRYIVNWCPGCRTAISDLETVYVQERGKLYTIRYPAADGTEAPLAVATTRPETLLGDTGVAVHPDDERYADRVGAQVRVPLVDRDVPILADAFVDPAFGTGAVKLTPGHDPNDFEAGQRHGLREILVIDKDGNMSPEAGEAYRGMNRFDARKKVVEDLEAAGLMISIEDHEHAVGHCQRCHETIEPLVSRQWFVKVDPLAKPAIEAVEHGATAFVPNTWSKVYFEWMRNIHDWCISRQLWWGHRIPAWYCDACGTTVVREEDPDSCEGCGGALRQDDDVLDTWFSSALWPFSTMGWPEKTEDLEHYYPTQLLITGHDIIFFWVARMMMMGLEFRDEVPFSQVYIHGLVRDAQGQKMSKSKGNTIEPREVQDRYGTDAVRFTMAILAAPGNDIPLAPERMEGYRAFANKLWNATRFVLMKTGAEAPSEWQTSELTLADRWILSRFRKTLATVDRCMATYRFDHAADALYHFVWGEYCDWYIELTKPDLQADVDPRRTEVTRSVLLTVLSGLIRMLHPMMPFITEELWSKLPGCSGFAAVAPWPSEDEFAADDAAEAHVSVLQQTVVKIRNLRAESRIDAGKLIEVLLHATRAEEAVMLDEQRALIASLVRAESVSVVDSIAEDLVAARGLAPNVEIALPLAGLLDFDAERERIAKDLEKVQKELDTRTRKLANQSFVARAPEAVVAKERALRQELVERKEHLERNLAKLGGGLMEPRHEDLARLVRAALHEDLRDAGDITSNTMLAPEIMAVGRLVAREQLVLAGIPFAAQVYHQLDSRVGFDVLRRDGESVPAGECVAIVRGPARVVLAGERTALNFLMRLSGIATATRRCVEEIEGTGAVILDTRKTAPGLRAADKYAVAAGGGRNHRFGLYDEAMIKDTHLAVDPDIVAAVRALRGSGVAPERITVEVRDLGQLAEAISAGAGRALLDNMDLETMRRAVEQAAGRIVLEASGGLRPGRLRAVAETGVDCLSLGFLTHSTPAADLAMETEPRR